MSEIQPSSEGETEVAEVLSYLAAEREDLVQVPLLEVAEGGGEEGQDPALAQETLTSLDNITTHSALVEDPADNERLWQIRGRAILENLVRLKIIDEGQLSELKDSFDRYIESASSLIKRHRLIIFLTTVEGVHRH